MCGIKPEEGNEREKGKMLSARWSGEDPGERGWVRIEYKDQYYDMHYKLA